MKLIKYVIKTLHRIATIVFGIVLVIYYIGMVLYYLIFTDELTKSPYGYDI